MIERQSFRGTAGRWLRFLQPFWRIGAAIAATAFVVFLLLTLAGVFREKVSDLPPEPAVAPPVNLPQAEVHVIKRPRYETSVGSVRPVHESAVASKLLARVVEADVTAGQAVQQGDVLVRLDDADLQARLSQAEATEAAALARKQQAEADSERANRLIKDSAISRAEYEQAATTAKTAASDLERAQQAVRETRAVLQYATISSPMTGIVVDKRVEAGDMVTPGQVLFTLYDPTRMQLVASVRESLAQQLKVGQNLPVRLEMLDHECQATVSEIVPEAEAASRSFSVKVTGPCPPGVYSGMFGRLLVPLEEEEIVVVPAAAVRRVGQLTLVDVVSGENRPQRRQVQLGREIDSDFEVFSGLRAGEKVYLLSQDKARR